MHFNRRSPRSFLFFSFLPFIFLYGIHVHFTTHTWSFGANLVDSEGYTPDFCFVTNLVLFVLDLDFGLMDLHTNIYVAPGGSLLFLSALHQLRFLTLYGF